MGGSMSTPSWRDYADHLTSRTRALLEAAEQRGENPATLRQHAENILDDETFQLACDAVTDTPPLKGTHSTAWQRPDDRHTQTYREITVSTSTIAGVTVDAIAETSLSGDVLGTIVYLSGADLVTLTADDALRIADELRRAAHRLKTL
ncbi:hypothetical protein [Gordonia paraffinivorans]|uniref:hypothetical protein n=1 Tax=Gordonia paraffinivorans TaxID=175628 RepID=UPI001445D98E|nr:hypothetical protein [Gordonia paraffinivorans]